MNDHGDIQLLADYAERQSQEAFAELVRRHVDLVFSVACRLVVDRHLSEDVTQGVFLALAQQARLVVRKMQDGMPLSGWLHVTARNVAVSAVRTEARRRHREQAAASEDPIMPETDTLWDQLSPHLDSALAELPELDRTALLL
ncbi:MAG: RNA polymerase sigma factor, partial [Verrucomicrobia bacterium]|nr:RNA polymerase sigma factor [Verrucomicrobiota bacterium]